VEEGLVKYCRACGRPLKDSDRFCNRCGADQLSTAGVTPIPELSPELRPNEVLQALYEELLKWGTVKREFHSLDSQLIRGADYHFDAAVVQDFGTSDYPFDAVFTYGRMPDFEVIDSTEFGGGIVKSHIPPKDRCVDVAVGFAKVHHQNVATIDEQELKASLREDHAIFSIFSNRVVISDGYWDEPIIKRYWFTKWEPWGDYGKYVEVRQERTRIVGYTRKVNRKSIPEEYVSARASPMGEVTFYKSNVVGFLLRHVREVLSRSAAPEPISKIEFRCERCGKQYPDFMETHEEDMDLHYFDPGKTYCCTTCGDYCRIIKINPEEKLKFKINREFKVIIRDGDFFCPKCGERLRLVAAGHYCFSCDFLVT
jgi:hypothetical protein